MTSNNYSLFIGILLIVSSCKLESIKKIETYSDTQLRLVEICEHYKNDYESKDNALEKNLIQENHRVILQNFLVDSLNQLIDSIRVTIDTVYFDGNYLTSRFHFKDIEFKYGIRFSDTSSVNSRKLFRFIKGLRIKSDTTLNFFYMGTSVVNIPSKDNPTFRIFALPEPLDIEKIPL